MREGGWGGWMDEEGMKDSAYLWYSTANHTVEGQASPTKKSSSFRGFCPISNGGTKDGSSVGMRTCCTHIFLHVWRQLVYSVGAHQFLRRSSGESLLGVSCWLGERKGKKSPPSPPPSPLLGAAKERLFKLRRRRMSKVTQYSREKKVLYIVVMGIHLVLLPPNFLFSFFFNVSAEKKNILYMNPPVFSAQNF